MNFEFRASLRFGAAFLTAVAGLVFDIEWINCGVAMLFIAVGFVWWSFEQ